MNQILYALYTLRRESFKAASRQSMYEDNEKEALARIATQVMHTNATTTKGPRRPPSLITHVIERTRENASYISHLGSVPSYPFLVTAKM